MGHYCRYCDRIRANEKFSGKGHRNHVCKDCQHLPKPERDLIDWRDEVFGFLRQRNISLKNMARLETMIAEADPETRRLAEIVLEVARVKPHKRRRLKVLAEKRPDLLDELEDTGLIFAHGG